MYFTVCVACTRTDENIMLNMCTDIVKMCT